MAAARETLTPNVTWAQRPNFIFITFDVAEVGKPLFKVTKNSIRFKGKSLRNKKIYEINLKLFKWINPRAAKFQVRPRCVEIAIEKVRKITFWERLLEDTEKHHWLKIDCEKWKDEEDQCLFVKDTLEKQFETMKALEEPRIDLSLFPDDGPFPVFSDPWMEAEFHKNLMKLGESCLDKLPEFHLEYAKKYSDEKEHIKKLSDLRETYQINSIFSSNPTTTAQYEEKQSNESIECIAERWGPAFRDERFDKFFSEEPLDSVFEQETANEPYFFNEFASKFQTMKNYNIPEWKYEFGRTHVSLGCVDFEQLLLGKLVEYSEDPLHFYGIDSSLVSIARCHILYQMVKNKCEPRNILQVWFSTAWSEEALTAFKKAIEDLFLDDEVDEELKEIMTEWYNSELEVPEAKFRWSFDYLKGEELQEKNSKYLEPIANLKNECDRVDFARYCFTGIIFLNEDQAKHGNVTMYTRPLVNSLFSRKVDFENFLHTFNFKHPEFVYEDNLMNSVEKFMAKKMQKLTNLVSQGKVNMTFKMARIGPDSMEISKEIKEMNAKTIDWSNLLDYFSREDFLQMVRDSSSEDTVHYFHSINWPQIYKGADIYDYEYKDKLKIIKSSSARFCQAHQEAYSQCEIYRNIWKKEISYKSSNSLNSYGLLMDCGHKYVQYLLGEDANFEMNPSPAYTFTRIDTLISGAFTLNKIITSLL